MYNWIGSKPTFSQKSLISQYSRLLDKAENECLTAGETILKMIEAKLVKGVESQNGLLILSSSRLLFISKEDWLAFGITELKDCWTADSSHEGFWTLHCHLNSSDYEFGHISKNDDSKELLDALESLQHDPESKIHTTVTHDFNRLLHRGRLEEIAAEGGRVTPFLLKRDNMGMVKNGIRMLQELHPDALLVADGYYQDSERKGNFIVIAEQIMLYFYDNKQRQAQLLYTWPLTSFQRMPVCHTSSHTEIAAPEGRLIITDNGRLCESLLTEMGITLTKKSKKWHERLLGFKII